MASIRLLLEEIEGNWFGWIEDLPGAFSMGASSVEAARHAPRAIMEYCNWLCAHGETPPEHLSGLLSGDIRPESVEVHRAQYGENGVEINAFFGADARPVTETERERALRVLSYARADLQAALRDLPPDERDTAPIGGRSVNALLRHLADTEILALSRLNITLPDALPQTLPSRLEAVHTAFERAIRAIPLSQSAQVFTDQDERWTLGKVLRRTLWMERHCTAQIAARSNPTAYLNTIRTDTRLQAAGNSSLAWL